MFWRKKIYSKNVVSSKFSVPADKITRMASLKKGQKLFSSEYDQFYVYLTDGRADLEFIKTETVILDAAPLWKMNSDIFQINENNAYINCISDCQFVLIEK